MGKLRVIVFNVEHGFCAFIKSPNNYTLMIDCGSTENFSPIKYVLENEMDGVTKYNGHLLTKFILTHPHDDHLSDIDRLKKDLKPGIILRQKYDWEEIKTGDDEYENLDSYVTLQEDYNQEVINKPTWGMTLSHGLYLSPQEARNLDKSKFINNSSIPTFIEYNGWKIVFPGDLEKSGWIKLLANDSFKNLIKGTSFFVTSHHGHSSGYCKEIYESMGKPHFNIVSANSRDTSVEDAYSKQENARGVQHKGEIRYRFSTRNEGNIIIEVDEKGNASYDFLEIPDNIKKYSFV